MNTLALPEVLTPWAIRPYPKNPPPPMTGAQVLDRLSLLTLGVDALPECVVVHDGIEIPVRYEVASDGEVFLRGAKINGCWADPIRWFPESLIKVMEADVLDTEREIARDAA